MKKFNVIGLVFVLGISQSGCIPLLAWALVENPNQEKIRQHNQEMRVEQAQKQSDEHRKADDEHAKAVKELEQQLR